MSTWILGAADDYIVKPFSPTELMARVRAALRRRAEPEPFLLGDLAIHYGRSRRTGCGVAVRMDLRVLLPQQLQRDAVALELAVDVRAVGPDPVVHRRGAGGRCD